MNNLPESPALLRRIMDALAARFGLFKKAGSFAGIGVVNTLVDFAVFVLFRQVVGLPQIPSNVIAWTVAVSGSYAMNSYITFAAESGRRLNWRSYAAFAGSGIVGLIANTTVLVVASWVIPELVAKVLAIGVSFLVNFSISHLVVFRARRH